MCLQDVLRYAAVAALCSLLLPLAACAGAVPPAFGPDAKKPMGEAPGQAASPMASRPPAAAVSSPPAFPGAEGFGASATGGRGGRVIYVTTLDPDPNGELPGSLNWALRQPGPRYILFKVSGVISAAANIVHGDVTIAGQTSPGGIVVRGLICDGHYERNHCDNVIVRHLRSRPARHMDGSEMALDDALRLDGIRNFIIDHSSFAHAVDEVAQVSWASRGTIQNSIFAETVGDHWEYGGMLMNYSTPHHPQDFLSIHHNLWYRLGGRLPEITCEASAYPDEPASATDCAAHPLRLELSNNLLWDPGINIWYGLHVDGNPDLGNYVLHLNWVNNYMAANPATYTYGMILHDVLQAPANQLYFSGNRMNLYPAYADYDLAYCCNDFTAPGANPNTDLGVAVRLTTRHDFPPITYTPTDQLVAYAVGSVGAFPRDPMDRRIIASLLAGQLDFGLPYSQPVASDAFELDFDPNNPPAPPLDTDEDGMPDAWELQHGLNPTVPDHNDTQLSVPLTGVPGYTNLECYLNWLSDRLTAGAVSSIIYLPLISAAGAELRWTTDPANCCYTVHRAATPGLVPSVTTAVSAKLPAAIGAYTDPAAHIGDPAVEDFYLVASCGCDGFTTAESQRVGYMDFALRRGE